MVDCDGTDWGGVCSVGVGSGSAGVVAGVGSGSVGVVWYSVFLVLFS